MYILGIACSIHDRKAVHRKVFIRVPIAEDRFDDPTVVPMTFNVLSGGRSILIGYSAPRRATIPEAAIMRVGPHPHLSLSSQVAHSQSVRRVRPFRRHSASHNGNKSGVSAVEIDVIFSRHTCRLCSVRGPYTPSFALAGSRWTVGTEAVV